MTTKKKILVWIVLIVLFNILSPLFYWLWVKHRTAFWISVVVLYVIGFGIMGTAFYVMSTGHHDRVPPEREMVVDGDCTIVDEELEADPVGIPAPKHEE